VVGVRRLRTRCRSHRCHRGDALVDDHHCRRGRDAGRHRRRHLEDVEILRLTRCTRSEEVTVRPWSEMHSNEDKRQERRCRCRSPLPPCVVKIVLTVSTFLLLLLLCVMLRWFCLTLYPSQQSLYLRLKLQLTVKVTVNCRFTLGCLRDSGLTVMIVNSTFQ
jgi:hypothetical protein